ncbi:Cytochrome P450 monooxygenase pvhE [Exophiala dermatitidis]
MILQFLSWQYLLLFLYLAFVAYVYIRRYNKRKEVLKLGGECPRITTRFIFGLDFLIHSTRAVLKNQAVEFWEWMYQDTGTGDSGTRSYTAELHILADIRVVFTSDPENIKAILATRFHDFGKGEAFHEEWKPFLGDGIFTTDGQQWHDSRQLIRPMFVRERVADLPLIEKHVRKLISLLGDGDGQMVMLNKLLFRFSLDASTDFLFGHSVGSLDKEQSEFAMAFDEVQRLQTLQERLGRDRKVVRDQLVALLLAGRDTTASTLSWLFLELAKNPQVVETLRAEIFEFLGKDGRPPTYQEIKDMKYLTYTINETLRLYPVVPFNVRSALTDTTLPHGAGPDGKSPAGCPRGTVVGYSTIGMQRRRDLYPPISESFPYDPADWVPDRILQEFDRIVDYGSPRILHAEIVLTPAEGVKVGFVKRDKRQQ